MVLPTTNQCVSVLGVPELAAELATAFSTRAARLAKRQGKIKRNCTGRVGDLREIHSTPWTGKASAISTPSPLSKVSSLLSKRNPLDTLDSPHRRRSRRRARHAAAPRCGVRPPLSEVGIVGGEYKIGEYNGSERCQPALGTAAVDTPPRQRGGWLAQLLVCYSSFFICLPGPPAPPGRCRARPRLSATTRSRQPPPACASSMGARRCWLDTPPPRRRLERYMTAPRSVRRRH